MELISRLSRGGPLGLSCVDLNKARFAANGKGPVCVVDVTRGLETAGNRAGVTRRDTRGPKAAEAAAGGLTSLLMTLWVMKLRSAGGG